MFGFFKKKDPVQALEQKYRKMMEEAMHIQRSGDLRAYASKITEAEAIQQQIEKLEKAPKS